MVINMAALAARRATKLLLLHTSILFCQVVSLVLGVLLVLPSSAIGLEQPGEVLKQDVGVFTQLGTKVDLNRVFTDSNGRSGPLSNFVLAGKPIIVVPVYYKCPRLCGLLLDGVSHLLTRLTLSLGKDFSVVAVSFDPTEAAVDAASTREKFRERIGGMAAAGYDSFHYLVGSPENVTGLMREVGFKYLPDGKDFAHSAAIMILTPSGEISQYFTGIEFSPWDVRLSLIEASRGEVGTAIDHLLLYCFRFDPLQGKYTWAVIGLLRVGGALTLLGLVAMYAFLVWRRPRRTVVGA
jgi:protein SCO1/2